MSVMYIRYSLSGLLQYPGGILRTASVVESILYNGVDHLQPHEEEVWV